MMWTHHRDRVLFSPEGEGSGGGPPVGQPPAEPAGQPQGDMISREEARKAFEQRDLAKRERDASIERERQIVAERDRFAAELEQLKRAAPKPPAEPQHKPAPDGGADDIRIRLDRIEAAEKAKAIAERHQKLADLVAAQVPDQRQRPLIPTLISGMHPNGLPDGELDAVASSLLGSLKSKHPSVFDPPPGSSRTANPRGPDGRIDYDQVQTLNDFGSAEEVRNAPDEVIARLSRGHVGNQRPAGMIAGSGRNALLKPRTG